VPLTTVLERQFTVILKKLIVVICPSKKPTLPAPSFQLHLTKSLTANVVEGPDTTQSRLPTLGVMELVLV
jgi:hypothetical protein